MAERRMFAKSIIDSDAFLDMPLSTQALYFHLSMRADDEGFVNNPKRLIRFIGAGDDELKVLLAKKFIIGFESGVIVIKHWKIHNYIQKDRFKGTNYHDEKALLSLNENNSYTLDTERVHDVRLGKVRKEKGKDSLELGEKDIVDEKLDLAKRTIDFLNQTVKKSFNYTDGNLKEIKSQINKLLKTGDTLEVIENKFAHVIRVKSKEWLNNQEMKKHLNPVTLFRESNFDKYLNQDMGFSTSDIVDKIYEARNAK